VPTSLENALNLHFPPSPCLAKAIAPALLQKSDCRARTSSLLCGTLRNGG
jgi:hypothetical protein